MGYIQDCEEFGWKSSPHTNGHSSQIQNGYKKAENKEDKKNVFFH